MAKTAELQAPTDFPATGYIRVKQIIRLIPFSRTTIWRKAKEGTFPRPVKLSEQVTAWRVEDVREWMARAEQGGKA